MILSNGPLRNGPCCTTETEGETHKAAHNQQFCFPRQLTRSTLTGGYCHILMGFCSGFNARKTHVNTLEFQFGCALNLSCQVPTFVYQWIRGWINIKWFFPIVYSFSFCLDVIGFYTAYKIWRERLRFKWISDFFNHDLI